MTYRDYRRIARENLAGNWSKSLGITFVAAILGGAIIGTGGFNLEIDADILARLPRTIQELFVAFASVGSSLSLVQLICGGTVQLGYAGILLKQYHKQEFQIKELFSQFYRFKQGFVQSLLRTVYCILWGLLFIIPGIVKAFAYAMTPFIMADHPEMTAREAMDASKELMDGHKGELFTLGLTFIGWDILAGLTLGIGYLWLNPYKNAAYAAFYRNLNSGRAYIE